MIRINDFRIYLYIMLNTEIADILDMTAKLMDLHGENSFKTRSYQSASFRIDKMKEPLQGKNVEELAATEGIGASLSKKIFQLLTTGTFPELETLYRNTPAGVIEMMHIKGIGPKKVAVLWKELGVESPGELLYACYENRLLGLKGFGAKTQDQIIKSIEFSNSTRGQFLYPDAQHDADDILSILGKISDTFSECGEYRRRCEIITLLEFVIASDKPKTVADALIKKNYEVTIEQSESGIEKSDIIRGNTSTGIPFRIYVVEHNEYLKTLWTKTGSEIHLAMIKQLTDEENLFKNSFSSEEEIYNRAGFHYTIPEMREGEHRPVSINEKVNTEIIQLEHLQGILHNHSVWSDGVNTIKEMADACIRMNKTYFGICDHSRTAVYAGGLSIERVAEQHLEIDALNKTFKDFRIFKGIESDILTDGSLDYPDEVLSTFDFVVASIHSGFKMDEKRATDRLVKAIQNPYTTILGHCTGRLLLSRPGYPINHREVIDACAEYGVVLELNSHPYRLDVDWRWIDYALSKNVMISINPDAHSVHGLNDIYYGTNAARKAGLPRSMTFNAQSKEFVENWFMKRKNR